MTSVKHSVIIPLNNFVCDTVMNVMSYIFDKTPSVSKQMSG